MKCILQSYLVLILAYSVPTNICLETKEPSAKGIYIFGPGRERVAGASEETAENMAHT